jgi:hypothetical protein
MCVADGTVDRSPRLVNMSIEGYTEAHRTACKWGAPCYGF